MTDYSKVSKSLLKKLVKEGDCECEPHTSDDCDYCQAEGELRHREHRADSRRPGRDPNIYIPGKQTSTYCSMPAKELTPGMAARYLSRPGSSDYPYEYAVVVTVVELADRMHVVWRMSNTDPAKVGAFTAEYEKTESLRVSYSTKIKNAPAKP